MAMFKNRAIIVVLALFTACSGKESGQFAAPEFLKADVAVKGAEATFVCELSGNRVEQCGIVLEDRLIEGKMEGQAFTVTAGGLETGRTYTWSAFAKAGGSEITTPVQEFTAPDQYEQISEACIRLRQKAQEGEKVSGSALVPLLNQLSDLRKSLQTAGGNMTWEQRERFKAIRNRYDAAFGGRKAMAAVPCRKPDPLFYRAALPPVPETGRPSPEPRHRPLTVPAAPFHASALLYVGIPDLCPGLLLSFTKGKWGGFVKGSVSLASMQASYACYSDGTTDSGYIWTTGKEATKRFNIAAGGVFSPLDFLSFYAGALFSWRRLSLMAGVSAIGFKTVCAELGVGYCF